MAKATFAISEYRYEFKVNGVTRPDIVEAWQVSSPALHGKCNGVVIPGLDDYYWKARDIEGRLMEFNHYEFEWFAYKLS